jgi:hypothetical protein
MEDRAEQREEEGALVRDPQREEERRKKDRKWGGEGRGSIEDGGGGAEKGVLFSERKADKSEVCERSEEGRRKEAAAR